MIPDSVIAVDPGPVKSAYLRWNGQSVFEAQIVENDWLRKWLWQFHTSDGTPAIFEQVSHYGTGMPVGESVFETVFWTGRFAEARFVSGCSVYRIKRQLVKTHICGNPRAKDPNVRQALIDRFGSVGTKKKPGPLYGVKSHLWAALAVAVTWWDNYMVDREQ